jgi:hypothetical protein
VKPEESFQKATEFVKSFNKSDQGKPASPKKTSAVQESVDKADDAEKADEPADK